MNCHEMLSISKFKNHVRCKCREGARRLFPIPSIIPTRKFRASFCCYNDLKNRILFMSDIPYFEHEALTILNDDFLTTDKIQESSIDLVVTSPPYNVDIKYNS